MLRRRRRPPGSLLSFVIPVLVILLLVEGLLLVERKARPAILAAAVMQCDGIATRAINRALLEKVVPDVNYRDLIIVEKDAAGAVVMAQINTIEINRIIAITTLASLEALTGVSEQDLRIPLGIITISNLLAPYGPKKASSRSSSGARSPRRCRSSSSALLQPQISLRCWSKRGSLPAEAKPAA